MTFAESISTCFRKYTDFNGIASRPEFWWFALFTNAGFLLLSWISALVADVFAIAVVVPAFAVGARRLHDTGRSGWWQLLLLIPVIGTIILIVFWAQPSKR